jgi:8-oxo-dGTP diphosphatase
VINNIREGWLLLNRDYDHVLPYTICIIKRKDKILLINKEAKIWMGRWNGVGGKIKTKETPKECVIREVQEETGIPLTHVTFKGVVTWEMEGNRKGGMYLFYVELPPKYKLKTPIKNREGILDWKEVSWILHLENKGVADTLPKYLPVVLNEVGLFEFRCVFHNGRLDECTSVLISDDLYPIQ